MSEAAPSSGGMPPSAFTSMTPDEILANIERLDESFGTIALRVPKKACGSIIPKIKDYSLKRYRTVHVDPTDDEKRLILLDGVHKSIPDAVKEALQRVGVEIDQTSFRVPFTYTAMTPGALLALCAQSEREAADALLAEVLRKVLPVTDDFELVSGFEQIGHIAHMNLREVCLPYKYIIGKTILDKNNFIRTVVNKTNEIDTKFRTLSMELLAGDDDLMAEVRETNCVFRFNYAEVYWNSKLGTEHAFLVDRFTRGEVIADMFAAKKGCIVHANDLNPRSYHYLVENAKINKVTRKLHAYNLDGREFINQLVRSNVVFDHVVMNLPASAVTFLDTFRALFPPDWPKMPIIHCYGFINKLLSEKDFAKEAETALGRRIESAEVEEVRTVAPKKKMMRISFVLDREPSRERESATKKARCAQAGEL